MTEETETKTNGVDSPTFWAFVRRELKHREKIDDARKAKRADRLHAKSLGVDLGDFDWAIKQMLAKDGGEGLIESLRRRKQYLNHLKVPAGTQFSLFDEPKPKAERIPSHEQAYRGGQAAAIMSLSEKENPKPPGSEEFNEWLRGYRDAEAEANEADKFLDQAEKDDAAGATDEAAKGTKPMKPRAKKAAAGNGVDASAANGASPPKKRGRPKKEAGTEAPPKKRGRPAKAAAPTA